MSKSGSNKRARAVNLSVRATEDEKRAITMRANYHGLSVGAFLRQSGLAVTLPRGKKISAAQGQFVALTLASLGMMMSELRRIENKNIVPSDEILTFQKEVFFLRDQCYAALGKEQ